MKIQLSEHFTYHKLIRFTLPSIAMMVFSSIYGVVDGFFISNYVGSTPFAAVNLIMPFIMILSTLGFMFGTGGTALVSMTLGEGKRERANEIFSLLIYVLIAVGLVIAVLGFAFMGNVARSLGATDDMIDICILYGRINMLSLVPFMLQNVFQSFMVAAERPKLGLVITVAAGVTNMVLDALFIAGFHWGVAGAAAATACSECVGGLIPLAWFLFSKKPPIRLGRTHFNGRWIDKACLNGASELMSSVSSSLVNMLYNLQLMRFAGADGVAAYGVIMYVIFIFIGIFFGYSIGSAPIIGYHYGAGDTDELKSLLRKSIRLIGASSVVIFLGAELFSGTLAGIFVGYDAGLLELTRRAFRIYAISFLLAGYNVYGSAFFTALNNGKISAIISFGRTLVFQIISIMILPSIFGIDGIWSAIIVAESLALVLTIFCFIREKDKYHYA